MNFKEKYGILYRDEENFPEDGVKFIDLTPTLMHRDHKRYVLSRLVNYIENEITDVDYIVSPDARGFLWGMGVSTIMNKPIIPVRKTGKLPKSCVSKTEEYDTEYSKTSLDLPLGLLPDSMEFRNARVVFVDDVYATGGTYEACKKLLESVGANLLGAVVVYDVGLVDNDEVYSLAKGDL